MDYDYLTRKINFICYKLEHFIFLSQFDKDKLYVELKILIEQRNNLANIFDKLNKNID